MRRGRFYVRLESKEWTLLEDLDGAAPFDGAVISDRYLAPWPDEHPLAAEPQDRLAAAVSVCGRPFRVDPDTARLEHAKTEERQSPRDRLRPVARALGVPLTVEALRSTAAIREIADAAQISQVAASDLTAPYLEVSGPEDPRLRINVELLRATRDLAGARPVVATLQFLHQALLRGDALKAARHLTPHAEVIVLRARRVRPQAVRPDQARALVALVSALSRDGARVIIDCGGVAGPSLVAAGAECFSAGTRFFQTVPADLHPTTGGGGGEPLAPHVTLTAPVSGAASGPDITAASHDNRAVRLESLRIMRDEARVAASLGLSYSELLVRAGRPQGAIWAAELRRLAARAA